jgi:ABC-type nitrate/sulfonate/bicarbonate transport system substrate-binding protein
MMHQRVMRSRPRALGLTGLAVAAALVLGACGSSSSSQSSATKAAAKSCKKTTTIRLGVSPFQDTLLTKVPQQLGWYARACLDVKFVNVSWGSMMSAMASGSLDASVYNTTGVIQTAAKDPELTYLYPWDIFDQGSAIMARPSAHLKTFAQFKAQGMSDDDARKATLTQLKGKNVVTTLGTDVGANFTMALRSVGMTTSDLKITNLDYDPGLAAFLRGTGDAYLGGIPQRTRLEKEKYDTLLAGADFTAPPLNGYVTTRSFYDKNQDAMLNLQRVTFMAIRYTEAHTDEVGRFVTDDLNKDTAAGMTVADFRGFFQHLEHYPLNAGEVQKMILDPSGIGYWKNIWDKDNEYFTDVTHQLKAKVPYSRFLGDEFQKAYVQKFGVKETGWWQPTGSL